MAGNAEGGRKLRATQVEKYGGEAGYKAEMRRRASNGGSVMHPGKGFASNPELASKAGTVGGSVSGYKRRERRDYKLKGTSMSNIRLEQK
jgi:general stress protein YciG